MTVNERIKYYRKKANLSQQELAERVGFRTASAINKIELGLRSVNQLKIAKLASALDVTAEELMFGIESEKVKKGTLIPVRGFVRAGIPIEAVDDIIDYEEISERMASNGDHFALKIKGDSMEPRIVEDDVVIIRKQSIVQNGELAVVLVNGNDATVKKFYSNENGITLISLNSAYEPFYFSKEEVNSLPVQIIGKVVELRAKF